MSNNTTCLPLWKSLLLCGYYYASLPYRRRRLAAAMAERRVPIAVLFYHRIADDRATSWTMSNQCFARQIRWMADRFDMISLKEVQRRIRCGDNTRPAVSITFDDGYAENCRRAIPLLIEERIPCTYFVTLENVVKQKPFPHDVARGYSFPPNTIEQLREMAAAGIEIGAHTYTHPDLAKISDGQTLYREIATAGRDLERYLDRQVRYFAFPFGQYENLSARAMQIAKAAGYEAVCSAFGGHNFPGGDAFHLRRIHADEGMIRLKNRLTIDPRQQNSPQFDWNLAPSEIAVAAEVGRVP